MSESNGQINESYIYEYDADGNLIREEYQSDWGSASIYEYDADGNVIS